MLYRVTGINKPEDINKDDEDVSLLVEASSQHDALWRVVRDSKRHGFILHSAKVEVAAPTHYGD